LNFLGYERNFVEQREALIPSFFNYMKMCHHLEAQLWWRDTVTENNQTRRQDIHTHFQKV
jgi:hypothetical protein